MSRQLLIDRFFSAKSKGSPTSHKSMNSDENRVIKKRILSLKKPVTPTKSPKVSMEDKNDRAYIDLCSDEDDLHDPSTGLFTPPSSSKGENPEKWNVTVYSDDSERTVIYSTNSKSPLTPRHMQQSSRIRVRSPASINKSKNKYYSPSKKRSMMKKSPVKKKLSYFGNNDDKPAENEDDELYLTYKSACEGLDDKTVFFLTMVYKYLNNMSLKNLLSEESQNLLAKCMDVVKPGMRLVCRLYWQMEGWYKIDKIKAILAGKEEETRDDHIFNEVLDSLTRNNFIDISTRQDGTEVMAFDDLAKILGANELKQMCKDFKLKINSKQSAIEALKSHCKRKSIMNHFTGSPHDNSRRVLKEMNKKAGKCYRLSDLAKNTIYRLYVLMYLGVDHTVIKEKKLELTLLYDKIKRETYPVCDENLIDDASIIFKSNNSFERYIKAQSTYENFLEESDLQIKCGIVSDIYKTYKSYSEEEMSSYETIQPWLRRFTNLNFYVKIMDAGIQDLKRAKEYPLAVEILSILISQTLFRQHKKADWYAEKALVLQKCGQFDEAAQVLLEGLESNDNILEDAKDVMRLRARIVAKHTQDDRMGAALLEHADKDTLLEGKLRGVHIHKQPMDRILSKGKLKFESRTSEGRIVQDVEEYCISHYLETGEFTHGKHWEGRIVTTIFFLLFWDIIYSKPANCIGIFLTRFQKFPLDLFCDSSFYNNRKEIIEERLRKIENMSREEVVNTMHETWNSRPESEQSGLVRETVPWEGVRAVSRALGGRALAALCRRLALDYRRAHAGFPDLTLWNVHTMKVKFVEVKSDTDKPSIKQIQWMHYLQEVGVDTEFCYVGVNTTGNRARAK